MPQKVTEQQYIVRPPTEDINENVLGEQCREDFRLTEDKVKNGQPFESVVDSVSTTIQCFLSLVVWVVFVL